MTDPFSICVGALGIAGIATSSIVTLRNGLQAVEGAQSRFNNIISRLGMIKNVLTTLDELAVSRSGTGELALAPEASKLAAKSLERVDLKRIVDACKESCEDFHNLAKGWLKKEDPGEPSEQQKVSLKGRFRIGIFDDKKIATMEVQLRGYLDIMSSSLATVQVIMQLHSTSVVERTQADVEGLRHEIAQQIRTIRSELEPYERRGNLDNEAWRQQDALSQAIVPLGVLFRENATRGEEVQREQRHQLQNRQPQRQPNHHQQQQHQEQSQADQRELEIGNVTYEEDARVLVGLPQSLLREIDVRLKIGDVKVGKRGWGVVGAFPDDIQMPPPR